MTDLVDMDIIDITNGEKLGRVCDFEIDSENACIRCIIVFGRRRCFGLLGREEDIIIKWSEIYMIGKDTILVKCEKSPQRKKSGNTTALFRNLFS
jgi:YlmC/YmxH family sporulation protein